MRVKLDVIGSRTGESVSFEGTERQVPRFNSLGNLTGSQYYYVPERDSYVEVKLNNVQQMKKLRNLLTKAIKEHEDQREEIDPVAATAMELARRAEEYVHHDTLIENSVSQSQGTTPPTASPRRSAFISTPSGRNRWWNDANYYVTGLDEFVTRTGGHRVTGDGPSGSGHNNVTSGQESPE